MTANINGAPKSQISGPWVALPGIVEINAYSFGALTIESGPSRCQNSIINLKASSFEKETADSNRRGGPHWCNGVPIDMDGSRDTCASVCERLTSHHSPASAANRLDASRERDAEGRTLNKLAPTSARMTRKRARARRLRGDAGRKERHRAVTFQTPGIPPQHSGTHHIPAPPSPRPRQSPSARRSGTGFGDLPLVIRSRHVRTLHSKLHMARISRALSANSARTQSSPPLQHRPDNDSRRHEIGTDRSGACPDALGPRSVVVGKDGQGSAPNVQGAGKADVPIGLQTHPLHRAGVGLLRVALSRGRQAALFHQRCGWRGAVDIAGLWDEWRDPETSEPVLTCTVIVTAANDFTRRIHDRMPVLLGPHDLDAWLAGKSGVELLRPAPNDFLRMWPVSKRVNVSGRGDDDQISIGVAEFGAIVGR
jgi:hypothetical protein